MVSSSTATPPAEPITTLLAGSRARAPMRETALRGLSVAAAMAAGLAGRASQSNACIECRLAAEGLRGMQAMSSSLVIPPASLRDE